MDIAIMIEGQNGLNWSRWQKIVRTVEDQGFAGLFRSDHFTNNKPPDADSLELWVSLTWLASHTKRIEFGPLVTPASFRHPVLTARTAAAVDDLSGGRLTLGLGAGWQEREHQIFGFDLLEKPARFDRFEEALLVITSLYKSENPVDFEGTYYNLQGARLIPAPARPGGPRLLIGGNGEKRTLVLAARYADEWNSFHVPIAEWKRLNSRLDELLRDQDRPPETVRRSMMTGLVFGATQKQLEDKLSARNRTAEELRRSGTIVGAGESVKEQLADLEQAGLQRVMLQWLDLDDLRGLRAFAKAVL